jgi:hypothetical protein
MTDPDYRQTVVDEEQLRLLSYGYLFSGVMTALFSLLGLLYAVIGLAMSTFLSAAAKAGSRADTLPPESLGAVLGIFGFVFFLFAIGLVDQAAQVAHLLPGRRGHFLFRHPLRHRARRMYLHRPRPRQRRTPVCSAENRLKRDLRCRRIVAAGSGGSIAGGRRGSERSCRRILRPARA